MSDLDALVELILLCESLVSCISLLSHLLWVSQNIKKYLQKEFVFFLLL